MMPDFDVYDDGRVQKTLECYRIAEKCNCSVKGFKILQEDCDKFGGVGTYNPPKNNIPAQIAICEDIINNFAQAEFDWIVLHECGHLYYRHKKLLDNFTKREWEYDADEWACKQQYKTRYGINALQRLCNNETYKVSHSHIIRDVSHGGHIYSRFTYGERINRLKHSNLPY